ncbi:MAG: S24 family peptidase [Microbacteriaceae bacterium]
MTTVLEIVESLPGRGARVLFAPVSVSAGWPSAAQDYYDGDIDLNDFMIKDRDSTVLVRVAGDSMIRAGINHNDVLVVNKAEAAVMGDIVIAILAGELTVKRLAREKTGAVVLKAENPKYPDIRIPPLGDLIIWGVVKGWLHLE